jgi:Predicted exonuclease of the beta-lactamase fold involved in RNA processing
VYSKELADLGIVVFRRQNESGGLKPHLFIRFKSESGKLLTFAVDTTRTAASKNQPDAYLVTHAHSDHYGKSAMLSENAYCSEETARALEIRYEKVYKGKTFRTGSKTDICGVEVQTFDVYHAPGSAAFYWKNELGTRILVTGDVKDAKDLPECDVLFTEASYGDPEDLGCYFKDDVSGLHDAVLSHIGERKIAFGAYEFGKSQKAVSIIREMGYNGPIAMNCKTLSLTQHFVQNAGELVSIEESSTSICIVPIHELSGMDFSVQKYVLTCRSDYPFQNIRLSDHLDVNGLTQMVKDLNPEITVIYHPNKSSRTDRFAKHLEKNGYKAYSVNQIRNIIGNGKMQ